MLTPAREAGPGEGLYRQNRRGVKEIETEEDKGDGLYAADSGPLSAALESVPVIATSRP